MEPLLAPDFPERPGSLPGPLGVALGPASDRLTGEIVEAALAGAADLGLEARIVRAGEDQSGLAVLLGIGFQGYFLRVFAAPPSCRRVIWVGEPLLLRDEPSGGPLMRVARSRVMNYLKYPLRPFQDAPLPGPLARARASATIEWERARNLREVGELARTADRVVVTSRDRRAALLDHGLRAYAVPYGYAEAVAGPLTPPEMGSRDLAFVSLARLHSRMAGRRATLERWRVDEPRLHFLEGVWGAERGDLLRRSKVVLNVSRSPGDFVGVRLVLAIAAGAVVVSEPITDPYPFVPGVHFVEAPLEGLLDAARDLEADEPRRRRIAAAAQALLAGALSMACCLGRALGLQD